jgi:hypothetical protein
MSSSSSSMGGSLALAAATAVAFSGSLVIFSLCRAHLSHDADADPAPAGALRPCLSSGTYDAPRPDGDRFSLRRMGADGISHALFFLSRLFCREAPARGQGEAQQGGEAGAVRGRRRRQ